jgi:hypothetical protein
VSTLPKALRHEKTLKSIISGLALGILSSILSLMDSPFEIFPLGSILIFASITAIIGYSYLKSPIYGLICGLIEAFTDIVGVFTIVIFVFGLSLEFLGTQLEYILILEVIAYSLSGYLGGYLWLKRLTYAAPTLSPIEKRVLDYIISQKYKIKISECAAALNLSPKEVEAAIESLSRKNLIKRRYMSFKCHSNQY